MASWHLQIPYLDIDELNKDEQDGQDGEDEQTKPKKKLYKGSHLINMFQF